jgi:lipopolysaccharide biosynthesis regulator YciM
MPNRDRADMITSAREMNAPMQGNTESARAEVALWKAATRKWSNDLRREARIQEERDKAKLAKEVLNDHRNLLFNAYSKAGQNTELGRDLKTISDFKGDESIIKAAMSKVAHKDHSNSFVKQAINLIKDNPTLKAFYESTSKPNEGEGNAEPGPSQTSDSRAAKND